MMHTYQKIIGVFVIGFIMLFARPIQAAENDDKRSLYIGDILQLQISSSDTSEEALQKAFEGFEIVSITRNDAGYLVTLKTLEVGTKNVTIGNQAIEITTASTLTEIQRKDIFEGNLSLAKTSGTLPWVLIIGGVILVFVGSGLVLVIKKVRMRHKKPLAPYEACLRALDAIELLEPDSLGAITLVFKAYLEAVLSISIIGKTSTEWMAVISPLPELEKQLVPIEVWLRQCDAYKYSGQPVLLAQKKEQLTELKALIQEIHQVLQLTKKDPMNGTQQLAPQQTQSKEVT